MVVFLATGLILNAISISATGCCHDRQADYVSDDQRNDAVIIDQLALYDPNPDFIEAVTRQLEDDNFEVDVYSGSQVTLDFYRNLPSYGYELLIFRSHAGLLGENYTSQAEVVPKIWTGC